MASAKRIASSVAVLHACSAVTTSTVGGSCGEVIESATDRFRNDIPAKPSRAASACEVFTSSSRVSMPKMCESSCSALKNRS
ncbi:hypothetical protein D3C72_2267480 [compost metagenome]